MTYPLRKRYLVTGGSGFLGSHLCDRLIERGDEVLCVDNFQTGRKENVEHLLDHPRFELLRHDVCEPLRVEVDAIFNLACPASPVHYQTNPIQTTKTSFLGAFNMLGLAKRIGARIFQASTSEVYGDPKVHPQREDYWGHVNSTGIRSCYDEGKRVAESLFYDYHRTHGVDIRVARIFNSLTGDQKVIYFRDGRLHHETFEACHARIADDVRGVEVPCFDHAGRMILKPISNIWRHHVKKPGFEILTTWGRKVKITEDHSLFARGDDGTPKAVFGHALKVGDEIAIPRRLPVHERPLMPFRVSDRLQALGLPMSVVSSWVAHACEAQESDIRAWLAQTGVPSRQRFAKVQRFRDTERVPMPLWNRLAPAPDVAHDVCIAGSARAIHNQIDDIDAWLWFLGFYLAEGCLIYRENTDYQLCFSSNWKYLEKLVVVARELFGLEAEIRPGDATRSPSVNLRSRALVELVVHAFGFGRELSTLKTIPEWVLELPLCQLKHFLLGFWEGDGNHDAKTTGQKLILNSSSAELIEQLVLVLGRFGIVGSVSEFRTRVRKDADTWYTAYRITVQGLDDYDILRLDQATQTLQAKTTKDLAWARVRAIEPFEIDDWVYDFSVPDHENFVGGTYGICCHNTYGPRMHPHDGRVVSNFIVQALTGQPLTIYGDGSQTRSFCYAHDLVDAFIRYMDAEFDDPSALIGPINLGNPNEFRIAELAEHVLALTGSNSQLEYRPLPSDDPMQRCPDIARAKVVLDWAPRTQLEEGLKHTISYFARLLAEGPR